MHTHTTHTYLEGICPLHVPEEVEKGSKCNGGAERVTYDLWGVAHRKEGSHTCVWDLWSEGWGTWGDCRDRQTGE